MSVVIEFEKSEALNLLVTVEEYLKECLTAKENQTVEENIQILNDEINLYTKIFNKLSNGVNSK